MADPRATYDARWDAIAAEWLDDNGITGSTATHFTPVLAQQLHDLAEQCVVDDIPDWLREREEAAYDAHINRQLDELKGK